MKKNKLPLPGVLENYAPEEVDDAMRAYYGVSRGSPVQRIWIDALNRHVPDFIGASGRKYTIYTPEMGIPAGRAHGLRKAMDAVIANASLQDNIEALNAIRKAYNEMLKSNDAVFLGYTIQGALNALASSYTSENHIAVTACTYFIIADGEDLAVWDEREARAKVEDWQNVNEMDFFLCCLGYRAGWSSTLAESLAKSRPTPSLPQSAHG